MTVEDATRNFNGELKSIYCTYCGKMGHAIDKYWTKQKDESRGPRRNGNGRRRGTNSVQWRDNSVLRFYDIGNVAFLLQIRDR